MPRPRIDRNNKNQKRKGVRRKSKVVDHNLHRTYVVAQQVHASEQYGYHEEYVFLFGKDDEMSMMNPTTFGTSLVAKNFISVPKGKGMNIRKQFHNMIDFKQYIKEIEGTIL